VSDVDSRRRRLADQRGDLHPHPLAQVGVQVGQRLVAQDQAGVGDQRPGQRDPLLLTAGQLVRVAAGQGAQPDPAEHLLRPGPAFAPGQVPPAQREGHVVPGG
jgi:hypothetical protein